MESECCQRRKTDTHGIRQKVTGISEKSSFFGIEEQSEGGFTEEGSVANNGTCIGPEKDARGAFAVHVHVILSRM